MASILKVDQIQLPDGSAPTASDLGISGAGKVLQVVESVLPATSTPSTTSSAWVSSGFTCNITPKQVGSTLVITLSYTAGTSQEAPYVGIGVNNNAPDNSGSSNIYHLVQTDFNWSNFSAHGSLIKHYTTDSLNVVPITLYFANYSGNTTYLNRSGNDYGQGVCSFSVMEVAQ